MVWYMRRQPENSWPTNTYESKRSYCRFFKYCLKTDGFVWIGRERENADNLNSECVGV